MSVWLLSIILLTWCISGGRGQQWVSPCPGMFSYDPEGVVGDRWWGTISITPDADYAGLWIRVTMDRLLLELGTDFGEATQRKANEFLIRKPKHRLPAGETLQIRVFARFPAGGVPPQLLGFQLNGRVVCPDSGVIEAVTLEPVQLVSPCPKFFSYEAPGAETEADRWYGMIELQSDRELSGVWLRVMLDRPSIQLGNWFGEVTTDDNKDYLIKNRQLKVRPGETTPIRFFVKYNPMEPVPKIQRIRLNAQDVCPDPGTAPSVTEASVRPTENITGSSGPSIYMSAFNLLSKPGFLVGRVDGSSRQQCGTVAALPRPLITHGEVTSEALWPWHAALYKVVDFQYICGGSLVTLRHVLTAAHCVTKRSTNDPVPNDDLEIYLGKYHLQKFVGKGIQKMQVSRVMVHPAYNHRYFTNDLGVVTLATEVEYTDYVRPVCLWQEGEDLDNIVDKEGTVVGWGFDHNGKVTETLTKAKMPVVSHTTCLWSYPEFYSKFSNDRTFCAGFRNGTSVCNGDSGGGLVFPKSNSSPNRPVWQVRGVVSLSVALQSEFICDTSQYAIFTDVAKYMDWIKQHLV